MSSVACPGLAAALAALHRSATPAPLPGPAAVCEEMVVAVAGLAGGAGLGAELQQVGAALAGLQPVTVWGHRGVQRPGAILQVINE